MMLGIVIKMESELKKDEHTAFIYYQKSAKIEDARGTFNVGHCYQKGIGTEKDKHNAFIYYQKSADFVAINEVGYCYLNGIGIEKDEYKAFIYYQKLAEIGDANGTLALADCYKNGIRVKKDEHKA